MSKKQSFLALEVIIEQLTTSWCFFQYSVLLFAFTQAYFIPLVLHLPLRFLQCLSYVRAKSKLSINCFLTI